MRVHRQVKPESWGKPANLFLIPLLVVPLVLFLLISPIGAQGESIELKPSSGVAGTQVTVTGTGFPTNKVVSIRFRTEQVGSNVTDDNGQFTAPIIIPSKSPGSWSITADAGGDGGVSKQDV